MILYQLPISHYCGKVRVVLAEKGIDADFPSLPGGSTRSLEFLALNPFGKVPVLDDDGVIISESEAICEYLEETYPNPSMLPDSPSGRAHSRWLSRIHDLYLGPQLSTLFTGVMNDAKETDEMVAALEVLFEQLSIIDDSISPNPYFLGEQFCLSDAAYGLSIWYAIGLAEQYGSALTRERFPHLLDWFAVASRRASVATVIENAKAALG